MKKVLGLFLLLSVSCCCWAQLPDAPQPQPDSTSRLIVLSWHDTFHSKLFWTAHGVFLAATVFDIEATHQGLAHHQCVENSTETPYPSRGSLYLKDMPVVAGLTVMDLLFRKAGIPIAPYVAPAVGSAIHIHGGASWLGGCW